jgi:hypothetical protein
MTSYPYKLLGALFYNTRAFYAGLIDHLPTIDYLAH